MGNEGKREKVPEMNPFDLHVLLPGFDFIGPTTLSKEGSSPFANVAMFGIPGAGKDFLAAEMNKRYGVKVLGFGDRMRQLINTQTNTFSSDPDLAKKIAMTQDDIIRTQTGPLVWQGHLVIYPDRGLPAMVTSPIQQLQPKAMIMVTGDPSEIFARQAWRFETVGRRLQHSSINEVAERQQQQIDAAYVIVRQTGIPLHVIDNSESVQIDQTIGHIHGIIETYLPGLCKKV